MTSTAKIRMAAKILETIVVKIESSGFLESSCECELLLSEE